MSIILPGGYPGTELLRSEGTTVQSEGGAEHERVLRIGLVNLMPRKEATELAFARLLAQSAHSVQLTLLVPASYRPRNVSASYLDRFYRRWPEVRDERFDGLIVTGAPVETLPFEEVDYWAEIRELFDWTRTHVGTTLYICWAAQAALYAFRAIPKQPLVEKAFGVFEQQVVAPSSRLMQGMGSRFPIPVSRHTAVPAQALAQAGLEPVARSTETGACILEDADNRATYIFDHFEYDQDTLHLEYERDLNAGKAIAPPRMAQKGWSWRPFAALFLRNWLDQAAACSEGPDPTLTWLFDGSSHERNPCATVLLQAVPRPHLLAEALRYLTSAGIGIRSAHVRLRKPTTDLVSIELDASALSLVERAAACLVELPGVRRVAYRLPGGSGGVLRHGRDPSQGLQAA